MSAGNDGAATTGRRGTTGPGGPAGSAGAAGPQGDRGPAAEDALISCDKGDRGVLRCAVAKRSAGELALRARLTRDGVIYARGAGHVSKHGRLKLHVAHRMKKRSGYVLSIRFKGGSRFALRAGLG